MWPHLKALCLGGFFSTEEGLRIMITGNVISQVEALCLRGIDLDPGWDDDECWERTFDRIETKFPTFHLSDLAEILGEWSEGNCPFCFR